MIETALAAFELTRRTMWFPFLVVFGPPLVLVGWYFFNERARRQRQDEGRRER
ncbi:MAG: hypothetical protein ACE5E1_02490 [Phycisphaerae bacterium]